jgi:subfamily B ATP-binding cassette protein MsbA
MELKEIIFILKRLYREHISRYLKRIIFSIFLSLLVAGATSATAWLLDPAIKKIFINNDPTYAWLIPLSIILAFITKGLSLYFARMNIIKVGGRIGGELQKRIANFVINTDVKL